MNSINMINENKSVISEMREILTKIKNLPLIDFGADVCPEEASAADRLQTL